MAIGEYTEQRKDIASPRCSKKQSKHRFGNNRYYTSKISSSPGTGKPPVQKRRLDRTKPVSTIKLTSIAVPNKPSYPLNCPLTFTVWQRLDRVTVVPSDLQDYEELRGSAPVFRQAFEDFGRRFDLWVQKHWRVPPHLRTSKDLRVVHILQRVVNWERYDAENPIVQPMWGRVQERLPNGSIRIFWVIGPHETQDEEAVLPKRDVVPALTEIDPGRWFYGTAKCYTDHVSWIEQPELAPAPDDEWARAILWQSLPTEVANEPHSWPLAQA